MVCLVWADGGYAGRVGHLARKVLALTVEVVKGTDDVKGFSVLPLPPGRRAHIRLDQ